MKHRAQAWADEWARLDKSQLHALAALLDAVRDETIAAARVEYDTIKEDRDRLLSIAATWDEIPDGEARLAEERDTWRLVATRLARSADEQAQLAFNACVRQYGHPDYSLLSVSQAEKEKP